MADGSPALVLPFGTIRQAGRPVCIATAVAAIPRGATAQVVEALGGRLAFSMLLQTTPDVRAARIIGDNTGVVRYGAGAARLRRPGMQAHLDAPLEDAAEAGWRLYWQAVRRRLNSAADRLAGEGEELAACRAEAGQWEVWTEVRWDLAARPLLPP